MADAAASISLDAIADDPHKHWHALREQAPVAWVPAFDGWVITGRAEAIAAMRDAEAFTVDDPRFTTAQVLGKNMLALDGAEHLRHRTPFVSPYRRATVVDGWTQWLRRAASRRIERFTDAGTAELRTALAAPLAVETICHSLDLIDVDTEEVLAWYADLAQAIQDLSAGVATDGAAAAYQSLGRTVEHTIATSDRSVLTHAARSGLAIDDVVANAAVLMFGAIETSEGATANALHLLLQHPDALAAARADLSVLPNLVEETMRLEPSVAQLDRYATRDIDFADAPIRAGDYVMISLAAANRDPRTFEHPDRFDPGRRNARHHLTFAQGPHACIGLHLARLETQVAIDQLLRTVDDLRAIPERSTPPRGLVFRKPEHVTAAWGPSR